MCSGRVDRVLSDEGEFGRGVLDDDQAQSHRQKRAHPRAEVKSEGRSRTAYVSLEHIVSAGGDIPDQHLYRALAEVSREAVGNSRDICEYLRSRGLHNA